MAYLVLILLLSTLGGTFILHYLKNFLLKEKRKFHLDWDGILERLCITYIILAAFNFWIFIPLIILTKVVFRFLVLGFFSKISQTSEPGAASQKVLLKAELAYDLLLSPAFAVLVGVLFK